MKRKKIERLLMALALSASLAFSSANVCYSVQASQAQEEKTAAEKNDSGKEETAAESRNSEAKEVSAEAQDGSGEDDAEANEIIEIADTADFVELIENCKYDGWSMDKTVRLTADLDLSGMEFSGLGYFCGTFEGNNHKIENINIEVKGSNYGFFRYLGENAVVKDLHISGTVAPTGTQENIGGLAGVNYGTVMNCSFTGKVSGQNAVGGIAGINKGTGKIITSSSEAEILATNYTGGIAGKNEGLLSGCSSKSSINTEELEPTLDFGGVDIGSLNLTQNVVNRNDMGGIAGTSNGVITGCKNEGTVGYKHTGYNVGGIAGSQSGVILTSVNEGEIYGRKDVGGIVGQAEPYIESEYLEDKVTETKEDLNRLNQTMQGISSAVSSMSTKSKSYINSLTDQYTSSMQSLSGNIDALSASVGQEYPQAQEYLNNINAALGRIEQLMNTDGPLSEEQVNAMIADLGVISTNLSYIQSFLPEAGQTTQEMIDSITAQIQSGELQSNVGDMVNTLDLQIQSLQNQLGIASQTAEGVGDELGIINDNAGNLNGSFDSSGQAAGNLVDGISGQMADTKAQEDIKGLVDTIDSGVQSIVGGMSSASDQLNDLVGNASDDMEVILGDEEYIEDISSLETAENTDGVISGCVNRGEIGGDLNVGGIAGTMNVEYDADPEFDLDLTETTDITLRSKVNGVLIHNINYGAVTAKKNCAGGTVGLQELGFVYDGEGYGAVSSDSGSYLGGIAGKSSATIQKSYAMCNVSGIDYVGGIAGSGSVIKESVSVSGIEATGEGKGSIAGVMREDGSASGNFFVSDENQGVDDISYLGVAEKITYEEVMAMEGIPSGFNQLDITFETEDGVLAERKVAYGGSIALSELPEVPEKEGCYVEWQETDKLEKIVKNMTVRAEYVDWTESVASKECTEDGKPILLAAGEFYGDTELLLEETTAPENLEKGEQAVYAYTWKLQSRQEKEFDKLELHAVLPEGTENARLLVEQDGTWVETEAAEDGRYLVAEVAYGSAVALVTMPEQNNLVLWIAGGVIILLAIFLVWRYHKRKK